MTTDYDIGKFEGLKYFGGQKVLDAWLVDAPGSS